MAVDNLSYENMNECIRNGIYGNCGENCPAYLQEGCETLNIEEEVLIIGNLPDCIFFPWPSNTGKVFISAFKHIGPATGKIYHVIYPKGGNEKDATFYPEEFITYYKAETAPNKLNSATIDNLAKALDPNKPEKESM